MAGITLQLLVLVTRHTVYIEAGDWRGNYASHLFVGWTKGGRGLICLRTDTKGETKRLVERPNRTPEYRLDLKLQINTTPCGLEYLKGAFTQYQQ
ncbi:hypothetical protein TNCV_185341 [Trichonephila clavipes]|nr:hypothetical protein TNCV_185341 [Trichonephila clavipes]